LSGIFGLAIELAAIEAVTKSTKKLRKQSEGYESLIGDKS